MASIHTSRSTPRDCHSDSAKAAASWVLPDDLSQSCAAGTAAGPTAGAAARSGTSATAAPAGSAAVRPEAVASRALKPSASAGAVPDRTGQDGPPGTAPARAARGTAPLMARCPRAAIPGLRGLGPRLRWLSRSCQGFTVRASAAPRPGPTDAGRQARPQLHRRPPARPPGCPRARLRLRRETGTPQGQTAPFRALACQGSARMSKSASGDQAVLRVGGSRVRLPDLAALPRHPAHSSGYGISRGLVLVRVCLRKKAGAVTRMKTKPITPASAARNAMMKIPPICQCRPGTVHVV